MLANFICDLIFFLRINFIIEEYDFQFFYVHFIAHRKKSIKIQLPRPFMPSFTNFDRCEYSKTKCLLADVNKAVPDWQSITNQGSRKILMKCSIFKAISSNLLVTVALNILYQPNTTDVLLFCIPFQKNKI